MLNSQIGSNQALQPFELPYYSSYNVTGGRSKYSEKGWTQLERKGQPLPHIFLSQYYEVPTPLPIERLCLTNGWSATIDPYALKEMMYLESFWHELPKQSSMEPSVVLLQSPFRTKRYKNALGHWTIRTRQVERDTALLQIGPSSEGTFQANPSCNFLST